MRRNLNDQIARYAVRFQKRLKEFGGLSRAHADLLVTAPAVCVAIITGYARANDLDLAHRLILEGRRLRDIEIVLGLPSWLRQLPPQAFQTALPAALPGLSPQSEFGTRVANLIPAEAELCGAWLRWVALGYAAGDEEFALWIAKQRVARGGVLAAKHVVPIAAFAWFSRNARHDACEMLGGRWSAEMGFERAAELTRRWMLRLLFDLCIDHQKTLGPWARQDNYNGVDFVPLLGPDDLLEEGAAMNNCLGQYVEPVLSGTCLIYSLRVGGARLANMEIRLSGYPAPVGRITQFCGPSNCKPSMRAIEAAHAWLEDRNSMRAQVVERRRSLAVDKDMWTLLWAPYWAEKGQRGILVAEPRASEIDTFLRVILSLLRQQRRTRAARRSAR